MDERPVPEPGNVPLPRPSKEDTRSSPKYTTEGIEYVLECWPCRVQGRKFQYIGGGSTGRKLKLVRKHIQ